MKVRNFEYVAALPAKRGELIALRELSPEAIETVMPLLEVQPRLEGWDDQGERVPPKRSLQQHIDSTAKALQRAFVGRPTMWLDMPYLAEHEQDLGDGRHPIEDLFENINSNGVAAVPVSGPERDAREVEAVRNVAIRQRRGAALRVKRRDFEAISTTPLLADFLRDHLELDANDVDLVVDLGAVAGTDAKLMASGVRAIVLAEPIRSHRWRSVTLLSGGFPQNLKEVGQGRVAAFPRADLELWTEVCKGIPACDRPIFGDYGVQKPGYFDENGATMVMAAKVRYTSSLEFFIARGGLIKAHSSEKQVSREEYRSLARRITLLPEFSGPEFSPGDREMWDTVNGKEGPGGPEKWVRVGTSHHLVLVGRQMKGAALPIGAGA